MKEKRNECRPLASYARCTAGLPRLRVEAPGRDEAYIFYTQSDLADGLNGSADERATMRRNEVGDIEALQAGDVIYSLISGEASIVGTRQEGYAYTQNFVKIDIEDADALDAEYLVYLLNESAAIRRQLATGIQSSTLVVKYTVQQLRELKLPTLPDIGTQRRVGEIYFKRNRLAHLRKEAADAESELIRAKLREVTGDE